MAELTYAGLYFDPAGWETLAFNQEAVYDDSGTDIECVRITIDGRCVITQPFFPTGNAAEGDTGDEGNNDDGAKTTAKMRIIRQFMRPRQALSFTVNGVEMIPQLQTSKIDCRNGPLPQWINVIQVTEKTFICNLRIISHWAEDSYLNEAGKILSHRWTETNEIDLNHYTRKTRSGKIVVSSSTYVTTAFDATLRDSLITTSIDKGFVRESSRYMMDPNGLSMRYDFIDQERFRLPPAPASDSDGEYISSTQWQGGPGRFATCKVRLTGPKNDQAAPGKLVRLATQICFGKLRANGGFFPIRADFREKLYRNEVEVSLTGRLNPGQGQNEKQFMSLAASVKGIGLHPIGSGVNDLRIVPTSRGTAGMVLQAAAYNDPTLTQTLNKANNALSIEGGTAPVGQIPGG